MLIALVELYRIGGTFIDILLIGEARLAHRPRTHAYIVQRQNLGHNTYADRIEDNLVIFCEL